MMLRVKLHRKGGKRAHLAGLEQPVGRKDADVGEERPQQNDLHFKSIPFLPFIYRTFQCMSVWPAGLSVHDLSF